MPSTEKKPGVSLEIRNLTKVFAGMKALDNVSLSVPARTFLALLGPSGCGKSTLLRCIAGLEEPDEGEILIDGVPVFSSTKGINVPPGKRDLGMVFQSYALWPHMTLIDNVGFGLELAGVEKTERRKRVYAALADVGLNGMEERYPSQLSGGQQQRVALARLLAAKPPLFLMDEPLSNLDARLRMDMRAELRRLHDANGALTIYVTHDQGEAMSMADTVVVMKSGRIEQAASPTEVYARPASLFVADFVAMPKMNVMAGTVAGDGVERRVRFAGMSASVGAHVPIGPCTVAFRPEDIEIVPAETRGAALASIDGVFPAGPEVIINLTSGDVALIARQMRGFAQGGRREVPVRVAAEALNIFDTATGRLIETDPPQENGETKKIA
jgi:ABC-type sugar transport system ATPase subunit